MLQKICFLLVLFFSFQMKAQSDLPSVSSHEIIIDKYSHSDIVMSYGIGDKSIIKGKYFKYSKKLKIDSKIKTVVVNTNSELEGVKMKLHFYNVNSNGSPGKDLIEPIIFECKKGRNDTTIDVTINEISIPENGIFVGFEWLIVAENKYTIQRTFLDKNVTTESKVEGKKSESVESFAPAIGVIASRKNNTWVFKEDQWILSPKDNNKNILGNNLNPFYNKYYGMAVSLILTK